MKLLIIITSAIILLVSGLILLTSFETKKETHRVTSVIPISASPGFSFNKDYTDAELQDEFERLNSSSLSKEDAERLRFTY